MEVIEYNKDTRTELRRITVPIEFAGKETYIQRLNADPDLTKGVQVSLPRMSYEMTGITKDNERQQSSFFNFKNSESGNTASKINFAVPYKMDIDLNIYVRNMEDGTQIVEQILPFFTPDYTIAIKYLALNGCSIVNDLPFTLKNISFKNTYEGAAGDVRMIVWTLSFEAQVLFYGPTTANSNIIREVIVDMRDFDSSNTLETITVTPNPLTANSVDANLHYTTNVTSNIG